MPCAQNPGASWEGPHGPRAGVVKLHLHRCTACAPGSCVLADRDPGEGRGGDRPVAWKAEQRGVKATKPGTSPGVES